MQLLAEGRSEMAGGCHSSGGAGDTGGDKGLVPWSQCLERRAGASLGRGSGESGSPQRDLSVFSMFTSCRNKMV